MLCGTTMKVFHYISDFQVQGFSLHFHVLAASYDITGFRLMIRVVFICDIGYFQMGDDKVVKEVEFQVCLLEFVVSFCQFSSCFCLAYIRVKINSRQTYENFLAHQFMLSCDLNSENLLCCFSLAFFEIVFAHSQLCSCLSVYDVLFVFYLL